MCGVSTKQKGRVLLAGRKIRMSAKVVAAVQLGPEADTDAWLLTSGRTVDVRSMLQCENNTDQDRVVHRHQA